MLDVSNIHTYYDQSHILQGVSLRVDEERSFFYRAETEPERPPLSGVSSGW